MINARADIACPKGSLPLEFLDISDKEKCENAIQNAEAILLVTDGESTVTDFAIDAVLPDDEPTKVKKIVAMSRNLNGKAWVFLHSLQKILQTQMCGLDLVLQWVCTVSLKRRFGQKLRR